MKTISDEMVEIAAEAECDFRPDGRSPLVSWKRCSESFREFQRGIMRAALEAVAGRIVEGERDDGPNENLRAFYARGKALLSQSDDKLTEDISALVERMKQAAEKATPGPWHASTYDPAQDGVFVTDGMCNLADDVDEYDAAHIATANPASVLALCNAYEAVMRTLDKVKADGEDVAKMLVQRDKEADEALDVALSNMAESQLREQALSQRVVDLEKALADETEACAKTIEAHIASPWHGSQFERDELNRNIKQLAAAVRGRPATRR